MTNPHSPGRDERTPGRTDTVHDSPRGYSTPETYQNNDDLVPPPLHHSDGDQDTPPGPRDAQTTKEARDTPDDYDAPESYANLDEVADVSPIQNPDESAINRYSNLEGVRNLDQERIRLSKIQSRQRRESVALGLEQPPKVSKLATQIYTLSHLTLFSILGTLARLGLQALVASYPGSPVIFPSLWPNFAGSLIMGFLAEDGKLFSNHNHHHRNNTSPPDEEAPTTVPSLASKKAHTALKKSIPLYIGLATGFCGSLTSFSSFMRDVFLAMSNDLAVPFVARNGGYSLSAVLGVVIITLSVSLSGLFLGAHVAIALEGVLPCLSARFTRVVLDRAAVVLGLGMWLGAVMLCVFPPDRGEEEEAWRGAVTFALVFAPAGCLMRFWLSVRLNGLVARFPVGTFTVNVLGTLVLGVAWDVAHVASGSVVSCQVLQGVQDGFCGCLTTVSTWVGELAALRRRHAYVYGGVSVGVGLGVLVGVMGGLRWGGNGGAGFGELRCVHSFG